MNLKTRSRDIIKKLNLNKLAVIFVTFIFLISIFPTIKSVENSLLTPDYSTEKNTPNSPGGTEFHNEKHDTTNEPQENNQDTPASPLPTEEEDIPQHSIPGSNIPSPIIIDENVPAENTAYTTSLDSLSDTNQIEQIDQPRYPLFAGPKGEIWVNVTKELYPTRIHPGESTTIAINVTAEGESPIEPIAVILVIDTSGSMDWEYDNETGVPHPALYYIKKAANTFIDHMDLTNDTVGVVSFARQAVLVQPLTHNGVEAKNAVNGLTANGWTNTGEGIRVAQQELLDHCPADAYPIILLFTDGLPTAHHPSGISCGINCPISNNTCTNYAREQANNAKDNNTTIFSIGFTGGITAGGCGENSVSFAIWLLRDIASGEDYFYNAPNATDIEEIYLTISQLIGQVVISDLVVTDYLPSRFIVTNTGGGDYSVLPNGTHKIEFTRSLLSLNDSWNNNFEITTGELGDSVLTNLALSNLTYKKNDIPYTEYLPYPRYVSVISPLEIEKNAPPWVNPGAQFYYFINITNIGHMTLHNVTIVDPLSDKVTFNSVSSNYSGFDENNWEYTDHTLNITNILMGIGDKIGFAISVTVADGVTGVINNTVHSGYLTLDGFIIEDVCNTSVTTWINIPPVVIDIPDQQIDEGGIFTTINLDNYVTDIEDPDASIVWTHTGEVDLIVDITDRVATITIPNLDWNGQETITFRATDTGGLWDEDQAIFTVIPVNDPPVVGDIPDQVIVEGSTFTAINLDDYVTDIDNTPAEMTWSYSGNSDLVVSIVDRVATISIPYLDWNGAEMITFRATDPGSLWDEDAAMFTVTAVNDPPVVTDIPSQTITEGSTFATISLDNFVSDPDNTDAEMTWTYSGNTVLTVSIAARVATITIPNLDWTGAETITFKATDPGLLWDDDAATFTVT
ncbi:MAG: VWA domain-containing protein, partial [Methanobacteriota archaeon]